MDIMKQLWDDKGYSHFGLTSQNLADILNVNKRKVDELSSQVEVTIATEIKITEATSNNNNSNYDRNVAARINTSTDNNTLDAELLKKLID